MSTKNIAPEDKAAAAKSAQEASCRLGKVGGQAVLEGVMMKADDHVVTTCRKEDDSLVVTEQKFDSVRQKHKILDLPILRGIINFVETMILSVHTLEASADALGIEEEEETKFEKWLKKHFGVGIVRVAMVIGTILGLLLAVGLFIFLPRFLVQTVLDRWILGGGRLGLWAAVLEGAIKIAVFLSYLALVTLMPEIKRVFMYHGAEHKSIACFEAGDELTPENAMKHKRFHPRCGTSFMFFMILLGVLAGLFLRMIFPGIEELPTALGNFIYTAIRLLILPLVVGIGYEFIRYAGKHENLFTKILSAPGLWVQRLTTKEPTEDMLECAITSLKCSLRDQYPEFMAFYKERPWEPKPEESAEEASAGAEEAPEGASDEAEDEPDEAGAGV